MRIRKYWNPPPPYLSSPSLPLPPPDLVSSTSQPTRPPQWPRTHRSRNMHQKRRINVSICANQKPSTGVGGGRSTNKEKSSKEIIEGVNDGKCSNSISAQTSAASSVSSSLSRHGWWYEEEKMFPLKKRRISLERFTAQECENKNEEIKEVTSTSSWRCSRANGVGWRCSNQRREGYALCEHHINHSRMRDRKRRRNPSSNASRRCWGSKQQQQSGGKDYGVGKKRGRRMLMISTILDRTVPLLATT